MTNYNKILDDVGSYYSCSCPSKRSTKRSRKDELKDAQEEFIDLRKRFRQQIRIAQKYIDLDIAKLLKDTPKLEEVFTNLNALIEESEDTEFCLTALTEPGKSKLRFKD